MRGVAARALASVAKQRPAGLAAQPGLVEALCDNTEATFQRAQSEEKERETS